MPGLPGMSMVWGMVARLRSLWRGARARADIEAEMAEEFRHHLELRTEDLIRRGLAPEDAARVARLEFGHVERHKADARASRGLRLFDEVGFSWLDVKLGVRMLAKHPGLSLVSVIGMAVAMAVGAGAFGLIDSIADPSLPLDEDERVVSLVNADVRSPGEVDRRSVHAFVHWRGALTTMRDLAAFSGARRNLLIPQGATEAVRIARMTASGFRVARVAPMLGRPLVEADERPDAPPVVVIAYEEWRRLFDGDPAIIGRRVRLNAEVHTVVGVMPEGFKFPVSHRYWVPLRLDPTAHPVGEGPDLHVFGRLADGATLEQARAELAMLGQRMAAEHPATHGHLRPRILPYAHPFLDIHGPGALWALRGAKLAVALLLVVVAVNVAILVYARTATRSGEIAVRSALGASRRRIVTQLFAEAFVLSGVAAVVGLAVAGVALETGERFMDHATGGELPFWLRFGVSTGMIGYVAGLAVLAGVIVGVLPALKATGRDVQAGLQLLASRGSQMQLGRTWTMLIVVQVAIAVAALPYALYVAAQAVERGAALPGYPADEFLQASLWFERDDAPPADSAGALEKALRSQFVASAGELLRRIEADPVVSGVTFASGLPGGEEFVRAEVEVEGADARQMVRVNRVDVDFLDVFDIPVLAGRPFAASDSAEGANTIVVDRAFVERLLDGRNALGRRVRQVARTRRGEVETGPWLEIVGVVPAVGVSADLELPDPMLYQAVGLERIEGALAVRMRDGTSPASYVARLRTLAAEVDPALHLYELRTTTEAEREQRQGLLYVAVGVVMVTASVLLLSAAGIYAMMSFTVARRRREIGIRAALGAAPGRLLGSIFARASAQLGVGVAAGLVLAFAVDAAMGGGPLSREGTVLLPSVAALMLVIGLLAAILPARRGLAVQPTEALREE